MSIIFYEEMWAIVFKRVIMQDLPNGINVKIY